ncbi:hypothetical protein F5Y01DRAFT_311132 [Xylaria sp. FL0043]|nr:hypothetical protein F5Y01DRAFT_311132 [Xylaria sp. FL0043]
MPLHSTTKTTTTRRHHGLFGRTQPAHHQHSTHHHQVHHHQKRHVTLGDKVSGALLKLKGTLTHRPGQKPGPAACTAQTAEEAVVLGSRPVASIATKQPQGISVEATTAWAMNETSQRSVRSRNGGEKQAQRKRE